MATLEPEREMEPERELEQEMEPERERELEREPMSELRILEIELTNVMCLPNAR